jgi:hypothetical protein
VLIFDGDFRRSSRSSAQNVAPGIEFHQQPRRETLSKAGCLIVGFGGRVVTGGAAYRGGLHLGC